MFCLFIKTNAFHWFIDQIFRGTENVVKVMRVIYIHLFNLPAVLSLFRCKLTYLRACIKEKEAYEAISSISSSDVTELYIKLKDPRTHSLGLLQDKFERLGMYNTWAFGATVYCNSLL